MQTTFVAMRVVTAIFAIAVAIVLAWLIRRLLSARVKAEFGAL
jgi:flagellar biogenesis protein FliO